MDRSQLDELLYLLSSDQRRVFRYAADEYAIHLLQRALPADGMRVVDLKQSAFAKLLQRPLLRDWLAASGNGWLYRPI